MSLDLKLIRKHEPVRLPRGILAHEVGHHVRYPGTLAVHARMRMIERTLLPLKEYTLTNLFTDLMINDALRPQFEEQLCRVYQAFAGEYNWQADPAFVFYLAVYEERWGREPGSLMGAAVRGRVRDRRTPATAQRRRCWGRTCSTSARTSTRSSSTSCRSSRGTRCSRTSSEPTAADPYACGCGEPSPDDWADALTPDAREREAIRRAATKGGSRSRPPTA